MNFKASRAAAHSHSRLLCILCTFASDATDGECIEKDSFVKCAVEEHRKRNT